MTPPTITLIGDNPSTQEGGHDYVEPGYVAEDSAAPFTITTRVKSGVPNMKSVSTQSITYTVTDLAGNAAEPQVRSVKVIDTTPPKISIIGNVDSEIHLEHEGGHKYVDHGATAVDLVDGSVSVTTRGDDFDDTHLTEHTVTYTSTDRQGNKATATRRVTVVDTTAPEITVRGSELITAEADAIATYTDQGATASDKVDGDISSKIKMLSNVDLSKPREEPYTVSFDVTDAAGLTAPTVYRKVVVSDTLPPVLKVRGNLDMVIEASTLYVEAGFSSVDLLDGDITAEVVVEFQDANGAKIAGIDTMVPDKTTFTISYTSTDTAENVAVVVRKIEIRDTIAPVLTLTEEVVHLEVKHEYIDPGYLATDALDGRLNPEVFVDGPYLVSDNSLFDAALMTVQDTGTMFIVKYTVSDKAGNKASAERTITIVDTTVPMLKIVGISAMLHEGATNWSDPGWIATDNYDGNANRSDIDSVGDISDKVVLATSLKGSATPLDKMSPAGTEYLIDYTVTDSNNNSAVPDKRTVRIVDTTKPIITLKDDALTIAYDAGGPASLFVEPGFSAVDTLDGDLTAKVSIVIERTSVVEKTLATTCAGEPAPKQREPDEIVSTLSTTDGAGTTYTITYNVDDVAQNDATTVVRQVILVDNIPPVLRLVGEATQTTEAGLPFRNNGAVSNDIVSGMLTGCIGVTIAKDGTEMDAVDTNSGVGSKYTLTYKSTDDGGLTSTKIRAVTLVDTIGPKLTIMGPTESILRVGEDVELVECLCTDLGDPNVSCEGTLKADDPKLEEPGVYSTTFSCKDSSGHSVSAEATIQMLEKSNARREGPTFFTLTLDLDDLDATTTTTTANPVTAPPNETDEVVATQFVVQVTPPANDDDSTNENDGSSGSGSGSGHVSPDLAAALSAALAASGVTPLEDGLVFPGVDCTSDGRCTVLVKGRVDVKKLNTLLEPASGVVSGSPLEVIGFEGGFILDPMVSRQATVDFPTLDITTADLNALSIGLDRAIGGDVVLVRILGDFKLSSRLPHGIVAEMNLWTDEEAGAVIRAQEAIRIHVLQAYRQLTETTGVDGPPTISGEIPGYSSSGNAAEKARALIALTDAGFVEKDIDEVHCTDSVCIYTLTAPPTDEQLAALKVHPDVDSPTKVTLKFAVGSERPWYAAFISLPTDAVLAAIEESVPSARVQVNKCADESECPVLFSQPPTESELSLLKSISGDETVPVKTYTRETACFEPNLQGGPSNEEGRAILNVMGLTALEMDCHPSTVCCFVTAFPDDLSPLLAMEQVNLVSSTVWGTLSPDEQTVVQVMSVAGSILDSEAAILAEFEAVLGPERSRRASGPPAAAVATCDSAGKQHCTISFDPSTSVSSAELDQIRTNLAAAGLVVYVPTASTSTKGSLAFYPPSTENDATVVRYLLVENNIEASNIVCSAGGCEYTVSTTSTVPNQLEITRAGTKLQGKVVASIAPTPAFRQKGAIMLNDKVAPIADDVARGILSAAGVIAKTVACGGSSCLFEVDHFTGGHTEMLVQSDDVDAVVFPVVMVDQAGDVEWAGSFRGADDVVLTIEEATATLLMVGIAPKTVDCTRGTCAFTTNLNVGREAIFAMFDALARLTARGAVTDVTGPELVDQQFIAEKAVRDAIIKAASVRPNQLRILDFNATSGEVSFEILPPCNEAKEGSLNMKDGCLDEGDHFEHIGTFIGEASDLKSILQQANVTVVDLHLDGKQLHLITNHTLTDAQKDLLAVNGITLLGTTRLPVLTVAEIQKILMAKVAEGEVALPLSSVGINVMGTNRTADPDDKFGEGPIIGGAVAALLMVAVLVFLIVGRNSEDENRKSLFVFGDDKAGQPALSFENPMYEQQIQSGQAPAGEDQGFYADVPGFTGVDESEATYDELPQAQVMLNIAGGQGGFGETSDFDESADNYMEVPTGGFQGEDFGMSGIGEGTQGYMEVPPATAAGEATSGYMEVPTATAAGGGFGTEGYMEMPPATQESEAFDGFIAASGQGEYMPVSEEGGDNGEYLAVGSTAGNNEEESFESSDDEQNSSDDNYGN
jgi:hypothetical protein